VFPSADMSQRPRTRTPVTWLFDLFACPPNHTVFSNKLWSEGNWCQQC